MRRIRVEEASLCEDGDPVRSTGCAGCKGGMVRHNGSPETRETKSARFRWRFGNNFEETRYDFRKVQ
jgi:hypothetical protein